MVDSQSGDAAVLLDAALQPAQVLQRIDHVICLFLSDLTACSLPLLELVRMILMLSSSGWTVSSPAVLPVTSAAHSQDFAVS